MRFRLGIALAALTFLTIVRPDEGLAQDVAPAAPSPAGVAYDLTLVEGAPYIDLEIDGHAGTFLFDTGANASGIDIGWMRDTGIWYWPGAPATIGGTTGAVGATTAIFDRFAIGDGVFLRPSFAIEDFSGFAAPAGRREAGILGMDFLGDYEIALDLDAGIARLATSAERTAPPDGAFPVQLDFPLGLPTVTIVIGGVEVPCRLDSGAAYLDDRPLLDVNAAALDAFVAAGIVVAKTGDVRMIGVGGPETREVFEGAFEPLEASFGPVSVGGVVLVVNRSGTIGAASEPLALAGTPILRRLGPLLLDPSIGTLWLGGM